MRVAWAGCDEFVKNGAMSQPLPFLSAVAGDTSILLDVLVASPSEPVPTCPGWTVQRLCGHVGRVHRMATRIVSLQLQVPPSPTDLEAVPDGSNEVVSYLQRGLAELTAACESSHADAPAWNMIGPPFVTQFWPRRISHETAIHRSDCQLAIGLIPTPVAVDLAIDGIDEFFELMPVRVLSPENPVSLGGSVHLHATDGPGEWMIEIESGELKVEHGHGKGAVAIRGTASELLLGLWGRLSFSGDQFQCFGDNTIRDRFALLGAF
jgi:uncharacterized protein (TIGR03083 family)